MKHRLKSQILKALPDILIWVGFLIFGWYALPFLFSSDPFLFDDHGFHYASLFYTLQQGIFNNFSIINWNPHWFAGIVELQFYPPGFVFIGVIVNYLMLGLMSPGMVYNIVLIIALYLPALAGYCILRRHGFGYWAAGISGFILLMYPLGTSGVFFGIIVGMINSRIALGLVLTSLYFYLELIHNDQSKIIKVLLSLTIGLLCITHPYHIFLPFITFIALLYTYARLGLIDPYQRLKSIGPYYLIGIAIASFWWLPLLAYSNMMAQMQVWTAEHSFIQLVKSLSSGAAEKVFLIFFLVMIASINIYKFKKEQKAILAGFILISILTLVLLFFIRIVMIGLLKIHHWDPWRLKDDFYLIVLLSLGVGVSQILLWSQEYLKNTYPKRIIGLFLMGLFCFSLIAIFYICNPSLHFRNYGTFASFANTKKNLILDELWSELKTDKNNGRVLFTASNCRYVGLSDKTNNHVLSLTPFYTGREILGAVNEPFFATSSFFYFGVLPPTIIQKEPDSISNESLLGIKWKQMDPVLFNKYCKRYNVSTFVVSEWESNSYEFLNASPFLYHHRQIGPFHIFQVVNYVSSFAQSSNPQSSISIKKNDDKNILISIKNAHKGDTLFISQGYYPRWSAWDGNKQVDLHMDDMGLTKLILSRSGNITINMKYGFTLIEWIGLLISVMTFIYLGCFLVVNKKPMKNMK